MRKVIFPSVALVLLALGAVYLAPRAEHALALRLAADEPERLADLRLAKALDATAVAQEIEFALAEGDVELAASFMALADMRGIAVPDDLIKRLAAALSTSERIQHSALRFGRGLATGNAEGVEGFAGAATGDLLMYGDVRDLAREGTKWARGEAADPLMAGLAAVGIVVTAGMYFTSGAAAPARAGVSLFKAARRAGKVGTSLVADLGRVVRTSGGGKAISAFADLGKIESKAGARVAMEGMRHADDVADLARLSRLAEKNGRTTLAILKTLGRGALVLGAGAFSGALWVMGAAVNIFLLVVTLCTLFASLVRGLWRTGRFAWRYGSYTVVKVAAAT